MKYFIYFIIIGVFGTGLYLSIKNGLAETKAQAPVERAIEQPSSDGHVYSQTTPEGTEIVIDPFPGGSGVSLLVNIATWLWNNYQKFAAVLLLIIMAVEPIVRWTPTEKDNNLLRMIQSWLDRFLPNEKKGGGTFTAFSKEEDAPPIAHVPKQYDDSGGAAARRAGK